MYVLAYMNKHTPLQDVFSYLLKEMRLKKVKTERILIYCQPRDQCLVLYRLFQVELEENMFYGGFQLCNRMVEMFHAGTPNSVKEHKVFVSRRLAHSHSNCHHYLWYGC